MVLSLSFPELSVVHLSDRARRNWPMTGLEGTARETAHPVIDRSNASPYCPPPKNNSAQLENDHACSELFEDPEIPPQGMPCGAPQRPRLRDQQAEPALQGPPRLEKHLSDAPKPRRRGAVFCCAQCGNDISARADGMPGRKDVVQDFVALHLTRNRVGARRHGIPPRGPRR